MSEYERINVAVFEAYTKVLLGRDVDRDCWIAEGVEHAISAQGPDLKSVKESFESLLRDQVSSDKEEGRWPLAGVRKKTIEKVETFSLYQSLESVVLLECYVKNTETCRLSHRIINEKRGTQD